MAVRVQGYGIVGVRVIARVHGWLALPCSTALQSTLQYIAPSSVCRRGWRRGEGKGQSPSLRFRTYTVSTTHCRRAPQFTAVTGAAFNSPPTGVGCQRPTVNHLAGPRRAARHIYPCL